MTRNFLVLFFVLLGVGCTPQCEKNHFEPEKPISHPLPEFRIEEIVVGQGSAIKVGDHIEVHYQCWLFEGNRKDQKGLLVSNTYAKKAPQKIDFGKEELIDGWQEGLKNMKLGGKRRLFIPSTMAFGDEGAGTKIPKEANLIYEIEVVSVEPGEASSDSPASSIESE